MSGKYALYAPKNEEETKLLRQAEAEMDAMITEFVAKTEKWHMRYVRLGSSDTASLEQVAVAVARAFSLKV